MYTAEPSSYSYHLRHHNPSPHFPSPSQYNIQMLQTDSFALISNFSVGMGILLLVLLVYDLLRYYLPSHTFPRKFLCYNVRTFNYDRTPLFTFPNPSPYPLSWVKSTFMYSEADTVRTHGLDVGMYIRFVSTQFKVFAVLTLFTAIVLYPTYITAENRYRLPKDPRKTTGIEIVSISNVADKSPRLWVTLISEIFVVFTVLTFLYRDMLMYTKYRRKYRSDPKYPSNFAVLVQDIPVSLRTADAIHNLFNKVFPDQVVRVFPVRAAAAILTLKLKYVTAVDRCNYYAANSSSALPHAPSTVSVLQNAQRQPLPKAIDIEAPPESVDTSPTSQTPHIPSGVLDIVSTNDKEKQLRLHRKTSLHKWIENRDLLKSKIDTAEQSLDSFAPMTGFAVVVFRSKRSAIVAATTPFWTNATECRISRVAEPRAVNWNRMGISKYTHRIRYYVSFFVFTTLVILWAIPATFIQALNNLSSFAGNFPNSFLTELIKNKPLTNVLQGLLPPLILFVVLLIIPQIVRLIIHFERINSKVLLEAKVRNILFFFYMMSNFFYVVAIGSFFQKLQAILENPTKLISLLATSVPQQATFLMKYVLVNAFVGSAMALLNVGRLLWRPILRLFRAKTDRVKQRTDEIFATYPYAKMYALSCMISLISIVYTTIAPVICAVAALYYAIAYICTKQLLLYSHKPQFEGAGHLYIGTWNCLLIGLYVHQVSMIGIFALNLATPQAVLQVLSFLFSIAFHVHCWRNFHYISKHGTLVDQATRMDEDGDDVIPENFPNLYLHPGLWSIEEIEKMELTSVSESRKSSD